MRSGQCLSPDQTTDGVQYRFSDWSASNERRRQLRGSVCAGGEARDDASTDLAKTKATTRVTSKGPLCLLAARDDAFEVSQSAASMRDAYVARPSALPETSGASTEMPRSEIMGARRAVMPRPRSASAIYNCSLGQHSLSDWAAVVENGDTLQMSDSKYAAAQKIGAALSFLFGCLAILGIVLAILGLITGFGFGVGYSSSISPIFVNILAAVPGLVLAIASALCYYNVMIGNSILDTAANVQRFVEDHKSPSSYPLPTAPRPAAPPMAPAAQSAPPSQPSGSRVVPEIRDLGSSFAVGGREFTHYAEAKAYQQQLAKGFDASSR